MSETKYILPDWEKIEVIAKKGNKIVKTEMTYGQTKRIKRKQGWKYDFYQIGFSQYNL